MKRLVLFCFVFCSCAALIAIDVSGVQTGTWSPANNPHNLVGDVTIPVGSSLTIEPGVHVYAMGNWRITAAGIILAYGAEADSIRFLNGQTDPNALWKGIRLENESAASVISRCYIENAEYGVNSMNSHAQIVNSRFNKNQKGMQIYAIGSANPAVVNVQHNIIERSIQNGILVAQNSNAVIQNNELRYNGTGTQYMAAIQLSNQSTGGSNSPIIAENHIHHNFKQGITGWDIVGANAIQPTIGNNLIEYNLTGIYLLNASGYVHDNIIRHNFIAGDANSGAGVMVAGATSVPYFERNEIYGNFTGFYIGNNAQPVLGDLSIYHAWAQGENHIYDNIDESNILHSVYTYSYTNPGIVIKAENNYWGTNDPAQIDVGINDQLDSAALPLVDYQPLLTQQLETSISGSLGYYGEMTLANPRIQLVYSESGEVVEEFQVSLDQPFSMSYPLTEGFYVVALAEAVGTGRTLYGSPGGLLQPTSFAPGDFTVVEVGLIEIEDTPPPRYQEVGPPEMVGDDLCHPVFNRFFVYHWEYINWLFRQGDYLCIRRHTRYNDAANLEFYFPGTVIWDKIANIEHGDAWTRTEILDDAGTQRLSVFRYRIVADGHEPQFNPPYPQIFQHDSIDNSLISVRMAPGDLRRIYHYDGNYVYRAEDVVTNASEDPLQLGIWWQYLPTLPAYQPTYLCLNFPQHMLNWQDLTLYWQAPVADGAFNWTTYRIYNYDQLYAEVPFNQQKYETNNFMWMNSHLFTVAAFDGTVESPRTNSVFIQYVANDDPIIPPVHAISAGPNPASLAAHGKVDIALSSPGWMSGTLSIYNLRGQLVRSIPVEAGGVFNYSWDLRDARQQLCGSGIYYIRGEFAGLTALQKRVVILK